MKFRPKNISVVEWFQILPHIAALVGDTIAVLRDGKVTKEEADKLGADLIAIVAAVA